MYEEALKRGYKFDASKISLPAAKIAQISATRGQIEYEFKLLQSKLESRDELKFSQNLAVKEIKIAPIFNAIQGKVQSWERVKIV